MHQERCLPKATEGSDLFALMYQSVPGIEIEMPSSGFVRLLVPTGKRHWAVRMRLGLLRIEDQYMMVKTFVTKLTQDIGTYIPPLGKRFALKSFG
jgi:hypothetical protein